MTDKMPLDVLQLGLIHACLPRAVIVLCRRRPIDTAPSIHRTYFTATAACLPATLSWSTPSRPSSACPGTGIGWIPPSQLHEVAYERLVAEPDEAIASLLRACGLAWNEACLHPERSRRVVRTPSRWQARQPITAAPPDAWRRYESWLGPLAALV